MALLPIPLAAAAATSVLVPTLLLAHPFAPPRAAGPSPPAAPPVAVMSAPAGLIASAGRGWSWPLSPVPRVVRPFREGPFPWSPGHRGADLAADPEQVVLAPADGVVLFAGMVAGRPVLVIAHPDGLRSTYEPVRASRPPGSTVRRGVAVGVVVASPASHCAPQTCLHWGALRGRGYIDPLSLLQGRRAPPVLLPLG